MTSPEDTWEPEVPDDRGLPTFIDFAHQILLLPEILEWHMGLWIGPIVLQHCGHHVDDPSGDPTGHKKVEAIGVALTALIGLPRLDSFIDQEEPNLVDTDVEGVW